MKNQVDPSFFLIQFNRRPQTRQSNNNRSSEKIADPQELK